MTWMKLIQIMSRQTSSLSTVPTWISMRYLLPLPSLFQIPILPEEPMSFLTARPSLAYGIFHTVPHIDLLHSSMSFAMKQNKELIKSLPFFFFFLLSRTILPQDLGTALSGSCELLYYRSCQLTLSPFTNLCPHKGRSSWNAKSAWFPDLSRYLQPPKHIWCQVL